MFKKHKEHLQGQLFSQFDELGKKKLKKLKRSWARYFYEWVFCNIDEDRFQVLYSENKSRPNSPVNSMVASLFLMQQNRWTYEKLFEQVDFDILTMTALGIKELDEAPYTRATLFNFQNRLAKHYAETGVDLLEDEFDEMTKKQIKQLGLKTGIQRTDSFFAASNIRRYSRVQLLIEVLQRLFRVLDKKDQKRYKYLFAPYMKTSSENYIYSLEQDEIPNELSQLAKNYFILHKNLKNKYSDNKIVSIFDRVFNEHFRVVEDKIECLENKELTSSILQSPDDEDATYRKKGKVESQGQSISITETADPTNPINLLLDVDINKNNIDDSKQLNKRVDILKEKTPDLEELHTDGAYGSADNDKKMEELGVTHIQTGIRGPTPKVEIIIEKNDQNNYIVTCPFQSVKAIKTTKRNKAVMDKSICQNCEFCNVCPFMKSETKNPTIYFDEDDYLRNKRLHAIKKLPKEKQKIRPNVEASVKEFKTKMPMGKLKVRGYFKTRVFAFSAAFAINFGRIYRYISKQTNKDKQPSAVSNFILALKCFVRIYLLNKKICFV
jgi:DDE family transposase/transposase-like protein DUF772